MARIIYGVAGEGFGHSSRTHFIAQQLIDQGHDLIFAASRKSFSYLNQYFGQRVREVYGMTFFFKDNKIARLRTTRKNLIGLIKEYHKNREMGRLSKSFNPDLVISDFEPFTAWWAWWNNVPCISINNEHLLTLAKLDHIQGQWLSKSTSDMVTRFTCISPVRYLIMNFFEVPVKTQRALIVPPVIRPVVESLSPSNGKHIIFYAGRYITDENLYGVFKNFPEQQFHIYGFDKDAIRDNCIFKKTATNGFLEDLASCRAVIATAGFSLLSECMYLKKFMLLLPQHAQYEQVVNAYYAQKLGLGVSSMSLDKDTLSAFLKTLDKPRFYDKSILWPDNKKFLHILEETMSNISATKKL